MNNWKVQIAEIKITQAEGLHKECGRTIWASTLEEADSELLKWTRTAPFKGYYKCDFEIRWADDAVYKGRYDMMHHDAEHFETLTQHVKGFIKYWSQEGTQEQVEELTALKESYDFI